MNCRFLFYMKLSFLLFLTGISLTSCGQKMAKADSLFDVANSRMKVHEEEIDSARIYQSLADFTEAIKLKPKFWQAYRQRSRLYVRLHQYQKAIDDITVAIKHAGKADAASLHGMRAESYYALKQYDAAISDWTAYINDISNNSFAMLERAKAYWMKGNKLNACADYKAAVAGDKSLEAQKEFLVCD
jgi:tetratricopeptide (TPR) repeat protein